MIFFFMSVKSISFEHELIFDTSEIEILENGNVINATNGNVFSKKDNLKIDGKEFKYDKKLLILETSEGLITLLDSNTKIKADKFEYNQNLSTVEAFGNVEIEDLNNNVLINTQNIFYDINNGIIRSGTESSIKDDLGNFFLTKNFSFLINDDLIKLNKTKITDVQKNIFFIEKSYINLNSKKLIGKDIIINFDNTSFQKDNEPRLSGNSISVVKDQSIITKGVFTTCKKNDDCPPWQLTADEIKHDKNKKTINYKKAWLKLYDVPVFYFPRFFHPDPSVKRQSGFLMPSFQDSTSLGSSFAIPYYNAVSENKDITFTPRFFSSEKFLLQTEYREVNKYTEHVVDLSFVQDKNSSNKSHFFTKNTKKLNLSDFVESEINTQFQYSSDETYLKTYALKSPIINNTNVLNSSFDFSAYREDLDFNVNFQIYENLELADSDKYEYIYPNYNYVKKIQNDFNLGGNLTYKSSGNQKHYATNTFDKLIVNDLLFDSNSTYTNNGFKGDYNVIIKNANIHNNKPNNNKQRNNKLATMFQYNVSYPLQELSESYKNILNPKISLKFSPNKTNDMSKDSRRIDVNNIYSFNRLSTNETVESGTSVVYGADFIKTNKLDEEILSLKIANSIRLKEDNKLPDDSNLNKKMSDIVGNIKFSPSEMLEFNYDFSIDENLKDNSYQLLSSEISLNNFVTTFEYLNDNSPINSNSYLSNKTSYFINESKSKNLSFETRINKETQITEFYNLIYQYSTDCLVAAVQYNKDYYSNKDLKPDEKLYFELTIIPFGETSSPNLYKK